MTFDTETMRYVELDELHGKEFGLCGVDGHFVGLRLDGPRRFALEFIEDKNDGYRSMLGMVRVLPDSEWSARAGIDSPIFYREPFAKVTMEVVTVKRGSFDTSRHVTLTDDRGHVWLKVGTQDMDDYYPVFVFTWEPGEPDKRPKTPSVWHGCPGTTTDAGKPAAFFGDGADDK